MMRRFYLVVVALVSLLSLTGNAPAIDFSDLADQSSYRCSGGIVSIEDLDRDVRATCGDPLRIGRRQDSGPIWIYYEDQESFMYYLEFLNGKLQRILGGPCTPDDADCFDLR